MRAFWILIALILCPLPSLRAQPLTDVPPGTPNARFFADRFISHRPGLSLNGFSCEASGDCGHGLGLSEVLDGAYGGQPRLAAGFSLLLDLAAQPIEAVPADRAAVIDNTKRLQASALAALAGLVASENGWSSGLPAAYSGSLNPLPEPRLFLASLRFALASPGRIQPDRDLNDDAIKWSMALTNLARMVDLYLALENAALHYDRSDVDLLTCQEKVGLLNLLGDSANRVDNMGNIPVIAGIKRDEIQAGNWPMKTHVSVGYAALGSQLLTLNSCTELDEEPWDHWLERAMRSAGGPTEQNRSRHWNYQTASGSRFFAEGPYYFHLALGEVIPFWHAIRLNGLLDVHPDFDVSDPFRSDWFVAPLAWLADLAGPDATTPPLDDGNREPMYRSRVLAWNADYGDPELGSRFAHFAERLGPGADDDLLPVELAVPVAESVRAPPEGLTRAGPETQAQQLIVRHTDDSGATHYVLLNAERGDAIVRGEGHEQPDQLQLLYYVDDRSLLVDSGYDDAVGIANSTWNHYYDHNVLGLADSRNGEGGVEPPSPSILAGRIASTHPDALLLEGVEHQGVVHLRGRIELHSDDSDGSPDALYTRDVIVVRDADRPYVVDINRGEPQRDSTGFVMRYHGGSDAALREGNRLDWPGRGLRIQVLTPSESTISIHGDTARERQGEDSVIATARLLSDRIAPEETFVSAAVLSGSVEGSEGFRQEGEAWVMRHGTAVDVLTLDQEASVALGTGTARLVRSDADQPAFARWVLDGTGWRSDPAFLLNATVTLATGSDRVTRETGRLQIFPNPASGSFHLRLPPNRTAVEISVFDPLGRRIGRFQTPDSFEAAGWPPGLYLIEVRFQDGTAAVRTAISASH